MLMDTLSKGTGSRGDPSGKGERERGGETTHILPDVPILALYAPSSPLSEVLPSRDERVLDDCGLEAIQRGRVRVDVEPMVGVDGPEGERLAAVGVRVAVGGVGEGGKGKEGDCEEGEKHAVFALLDGWLGRGRWGRQG
jgi:hypothetical protein